MGDYFYPRWRMVIHREIDGFICLMVYLDASSDNHAQTVFELFLQAVRNMACHLRYAVKKEVKKPGCSSFQSWSIEGQTATRI